jgi:hypothetical protein
MPEQRRPVRAAVPAPRGAPLPEDRHAVRADPPGVDGDVAASVADRSPFGSRTPRWSPRSSGTRSMIRSRLSPRHTGTPRPRPAADRMIALLRRHGGHAELRVAGACARLTRSGSSAPRSPTASASTSSDRVHPARPAGHAGRAGGRTRPQWGGTAARSPMAESDGGHRTLTRGRDGFARTCFSNIRARLVLHRRRSGAGSRQVGAPVRWLASMSPHRRACRRRTLSTRRARRSPLRASWVCRAPRGGEGDRRWGGSGHGDLLKVVSTGKSERAAGPAPTSRDALSHQRYS